MECANCNKTIDSNAKYCNYCGVRLVSQSVPEKKDFKRISLSLFNLKNKKSFIESLVLYGVFVAIVLPIYFVIPTSQDDEIFLLNTTICLCLALMISWLKGIRSSYIWAIVGALIGYLFGLFAGLAVLIPVLMVNSNSKFSSLGLIEKEYIFGLYKKGIILYLLGTIVTVISYASSSEEGTYTIWYGAVLWGIVSIFQGIYYQSRPELILKKINDYYERNGEYPKDQKFWQISPGFKKFLIYFAVLMVVIIFISVLGSL